MLDQIFRSTPAPKIILVKDTFAHQGKELMRYLISSSANVYNGSVDVLQYSREKHSVLPETISSNTILHDYYSNILGWLKDGPKPEDIWGIAADVAAKKGVLVIDNLASMIFEQGLLEAYRKIHHFKMNPEIKQVIMLLHIDTVKDLDKILNYFDQLAILSIQLEPKFHSDKKRLSYIYKKPSGKIIKEIEHFSFKQGELCCESIEKLDVLSLIQENMKPEILPEKLSTFKIGLNEDDRIARANVILPYLPGEKKGVTIHYQMDNFDDWDEEDPDDDLDI